MTKTIVITSGKGGVGKTNISVNLALELSKREFRTCLFDADFGLANVDILLGLRPEVTLDDCIFGDKKLHEIILHTTAGIDIIPGSSGIEKVANLPPDKIVALVSSFSELTGYDYFLIDTSSGISTSVISFCLASSETIVVITSEATSLIDAYALVKVMAKNGYTGTVKVLVNKCADVPTSKRTYLRFKKAVDSHLDIDVAPAGIVLRDTNFESALKHQEPLLNLYPNSIGSQCIRSLVSILLHSNTIEEKSPDFGEFWQRYFDFSSSGLSIPENLQEESEQIEPSAIEQPKEDEAPTVLPHVVPPEPEEDMESLLQSREATITMSTNRSEQPETEMQRQPTREDSAAKLPNDEATIEMQKLPSPIPLLSRCLDLQSRGALLQSELFEMFSCDPALMLKALGLLSPSPSRKPKRIISIRQLLNEIGPGPLSTLLTNVTMQEALTGSIADSHFVNLFWYHSYKAALIAQKLAAETNYPYPEEAFLSGLIHDIGRLAFQTSSPGVYRESPLTFNTGRPILKAEQQFFGSDHAEKGAACLQGLHLNSFIADAVRYHTEPESIIATAFDLVKIVSVASKLTNLSRKDREQALQRGTDLLDLSLEQLEECVTKAEEKVEVAAERLQIDLIKEPGQTRSENDRRLFKKQAVDYTLLQGILPNPEPTRDLAQIIHRIHQGLHVLFGIQHALCLMPNKESSCLQAVGYQDCFGWEILADIILPFNSLKSVIVKSFTSNEMQVVIEAEAANVLSLAERQIIHYLHSDGLACVPMVVDGESLGMIIFGIKESEFNRINEQQGKLQQFGAQSARNIIVLEQITQPGQNDRPFSLPKIRNVQDDLLN